MTRIVSAPSPCARRSDSCCGCVCVAEALWLLSSSAGLSFARLRREGKTGGMERVQQAPGKGWRWKGCNKHLVRVGEGSRRDGGGATGTWYRLEMGGVHQAPGKRLEMAAGGMEGVQQAPGKRLEMAAGGMEGVQQALGKGWRWQPAGWHLARVGDEAEVDVSGGEDGERADVARMAVSGGEEGEEVDVARMAVAGGETGGETDAARMAVSG